MSHSAEGVASSAADGRASFVDSVISDVSSQIGQAIPGEVRDFILSDVIRTENEWRDGLMTENLIQDKLLKFWWGTERANERSARQLDDSFMRESFYIVIHDRWHCPFPFFFC